MEISTHVLDTARGVPAAGVAVRLERLEGADWRPAADGTTDADGRVRSLGPEPAPGAYRLRFDVGPYFAARGETAFFPSIEVAFNAPAGTARVHVPLLVSPFAYSTYRGS